MAGPPLDEPAFPEDFACPESPPADFVPPVLLAPELPFAEPAPDEPVFDESPAAEPDPLEESDFASPLLPSPPPLTSPPLVASSVFPPSALPSLDEDSSEVLASGGFLPFSRKSVAYQPVPLS